MEINTLNDPQNNEIMSVGERRLRRTWRHRRPVFETHVRYRNQQTMRYNPSIKILVDRFGGLHTAITIYNFLQT